MIQRVGWRDNCRHNPACRSLNEHESRPAPASGVFYGAGQGAEASGAPDEMEFRTGYEMDGKGNLLKKPVLYHSADATFQPAPAIQNELIQVNESSGAGAALYCLVCGRELASDQWVYCPDCGGRLRAALTPPPPAAIPIEQIAAAMADPLIGPMVEAMLGRPPAEPMLDVEEVTDLVGHDIHMRFWGGVAEKHNTLPDGEPFGDCYKCRVVRDAIRAAILAARNE